MGIHIRFGSVRIWFGCQAVFLPEEMVLIVENNSLLKSIQPKVIFKLAIFTTREMNLHRTWIVQEKIEGILHLWQLQHLYRVHQSSAITPTVV